MSCLKTEHLIIGGGISGLAFARYSDDFQLFEKEDELGGYCRTIRKGPFIWDYAGHFFHFKTEEFKRLFVDEVPKDDIIYRDKCTKILYNGAKVDYPFQTNIHQLPKDEFIDCLYDLFTKTEKESYDSFLDMLYGKFGKSIVEKFLKPYNEKLYATDLSTLDVDAMGRFFPYADKEAIIRNMKESKNSSYNNSFLYPKAGAGSFIDILSSELDKNRVHTGESVVSIDRKNKFAVTSKGREIKYRHLINTIPLNVFLPMIGENSLCEKLSYNKVLVFNLGFSKKSSFTDEHWLYIPDKACNFYRAGFYDNILGQDKLSMYIEIGYGKNDVIDDKETEKQLALTLENLKKLGIIDGDNRLEAYSSIVMDPAYVHITKDTDALIKAFFARAAEEEIYSIGRYGAWTYCSMEDCMLSAKKLAETIKTGAAMIKS